MSPAKKTRRTPVVDKGKQVHHDKKLQKRKLINSDLDTPGKNMKNIKKVTPDANTGGPATRTRGGKQAHRDKKLQKRKLIISPDSDLDTPGENMKKIKKADGDAGGPATRTRAGQQSRTDSEAKKIVKRKLIVDSDSGMWLDEALFDVDWGSFYFTTQVTPVKNSSSVVLADQAKPVNATQENPPAVDPKTTNDPEDDPIDDDYSCYSPNTLVSWANHNPWESELSPEPLSTEIEYGTPRSFLD
ncbi:uncharacterized protein LOC110870850 isoform X2 [Helianthus annuus]|uniref:uncharacterized protein LOC110870850 isoform X2 n=1 Tax=Helianthus annuus TaxID=4232 RepID=UPI000B9067FC|nr:uncharacterized protein LOC110870850 isoform X2 [Helianthus annuus]